MRFYMDIISGYIAKMTVNEDKSVIFDGVAYTSDEEALRADISSIWMQSGYAAEEREES